MIEEENKNCLEAYVHLQEQLQRIKNCQCGVFGLLFSSEIKGYEIKKLAQGIYPDDPKH